MGIIESEPKYTLTRGHVQLLDLLSDLGFTPEEEVDFPPYTVDCYLSELHVAVEFDGPFHSRRQDRKRDEMLFAEYALPVVRVSDLDPEGMARQLCIGAFGWWAASAPARRQVRGSR